MGSEDAIDLEETVAPVNLTKPWMTYDRQVLTLLGKALIVNEVELTDKHINFAQALLKQQYDISSLWSSLLLSIYYEFSSHYTCFTDHALSR